MGDIQKVDRYVTTDGKEFDNLGRATGHQVMVNGANKATEQLRNGRNIAEILRGMNYPAEIDPVLEQVTKDSRLVISYWQCRDTPGYKPVRVLPSGSVYVWGNAGCWSGPYGGEVKIADLVRYAKDERSILQPADSEAES